MVGDGDFERRWGVANGAGEGSMAGRRQREEMVDLAEAGVGEGGAKDGRGGEPEAVAITFVACPKEQANAALAAAASSKHKREWAAALVEFEAERERLTARLEPMPINYHANHLSCSVVFS